MASSEYCADLGLLGFFKYTNFLLANAGWALRLLGFDTSSWRFDIILPVGISFFTFKSMSYTVDVYRRSIQPCQSLRDYLLFVSFFPQLLAGPIARAADLLPQLALPVRATAVQIEAGLAQFGLGAPRSWSLRTRLPATWTSSLPAPGQYDALTLLQGAFGYTVQIYCDFSGYSDMAIGAARILGYRTAENFQMPYSATDITEFWRRWHISLSSWFRDYLFLPLAYALSRRMPAERYGPVRVDVVIYVVAILATFSVCGLWHGASWTFVFWGVLHGQRSQSTAAGNFGVHSKGLPQASFRFGWRVISHVATLGVVVVGWILFRAESLHTAWSTRAHRHVGGRHTASIAVHHPGLLCGARRPLADRQGPELGDGGHAAAGAVRLLFYASLVFVIVSFGATDAAPFIYFQF